MGRKVHPTGFRIGVIRDWQARWYADKHYADFLQEDLKLRKAIQGKYTDAGISRVEIDRQANRVSVTIHTARPGIVIGRGGQRVDEMRGYLEGLIGKKIQLNIQEIHHPELDAFLVARSVADQMERRVAYRRAMKQAMFRTIQAGAKGVRVNCAGRLGGAEIARRQTMHEGRVPLHTIRADIDYGFTEARTTMGRIGVKVWVYKGDILPEVAAVEEVTAPAAAAEGAPIEAAATEAAAPVEAMPAATPVAEAPPAAELASPAEAKPAGEPAEAGEASPAAETKPKPARAPRTRKAKPETTAVTAPSEEPEAKAAEPAPSAEAEAKPARAPRSRKVKKEVEPEASMEPAPEEGDNAAT
ncbi:MAG: 30S ribosomal protein S3 [Chloroflexi bacterium]|nr:30S ribosomal protein S3 [Chloroflexota bacterium]